MEIVDDILLEPLDIGCTRVVADPFQHLVAVTAIPEQIVRASHRVATLRIDRLVLARGAVEDFYVAHAARPAVHLDESLVHIEDHGTLNRRIEGVDQAGHMQETTEVDRVGRHAVFQHVQDQLARQVRGAGRVVEGKYREEVVVADITGRQILAKRTAAQHRDVRAHRDAERVGAEVAQRRLPIAHQPVALGILGREHDF